MSNWISVEDRLPEDLQDVLLLWWYRDISGIEFEYAVGHCEESSFYENREMMTIYPTHWQPLPEPPKEDEL